MLTNRTQIILELLKALFDVFLLDLTLTDSLIQLIKVGRLVPLIIDADVELLSAQVKPQGARLDRCLWLLADNRSRGEFNAVDLLRQVQVYIALVLDLLQLIRRRGKAALSVTELVRVDLYCISGQRKPNILTAFQPNAFNAFTACLSKLR